MSDQEDRNTEIFDEHWYELELERLTEKWDDDFLKRSWQLPEGAWPGDSSCLFNIVNLSVEMTREFADDVANTVRLIWQGCGNSETPDFIAHNLGPRVETAIEGREGKIVNELSHMHPFYDSQDLENAKHHVAVETRVLQRELSRGRRIDIRKLSHGRVSSPARSQSMGFIGLAGGLWRDARKNNQSVSTEALKEIAAKLDSSGYTDPASHLEKTYADQVRKFNTSNSNSKNGAIKTWSRLVAIGDKDHIRGMRRTLSRCARQK